MSAPSTSKIRIAGTGAIWKAPLGTALPTDSITAWNAAFVNLGYLEDGFELEQDLTTKDLNAWQTVETIRTITTMLIRKLLFTINQTDKDTVALALGGATISRPWNLCRYSHHRHHNWSDYNLSGSWPLSWSNIPNARCGQWNPIRL